MNIKLSQVRFFLWKKQGIVNEETACIISHFIYSQIPVVKVCHNKIMKRNFTTNCKQISEISILYSELYSAEKLAIT